MFTTTKKKTSRWQALMLAGLVLAGGAVSVPHAADAATTKDKVCSPFTTVCKVQLSVKKSGSASIRSLYISFDGQLGISGRGPAYEVRDLTRGSVLCKGTSRYPGQSIWCKIPNRAATVSVEFRTNMNMGTASARLY
ncbi:hypothetical protein [Microbacterium sp. NPDC087665]|uniref:hypothetical protein n=1 Tax=Microbacterium sp. NPDC087665 TaxID=3364194 RepID=UPI00380DBC4A